MSYPLPTDRICCNCKHWQTIDPDHAVVAPCALENITRPEFWQSCSGFESRERAAAEQMTQQSACRGTLTQTITFYGRGPDYWQPHIDRAVAQLTATGCAVCRVEIIPLQREGFPGAVARISYERVAV